MCSFTQKAHCGGHSPPRPARGPVDRARGPAGPGAKDPGARLPGSQTPSPPKSLALAHHEIHMFAMCRRTDFPSDPGSYGLTHNCLRQHVGVDPRCEDNAPLDFLS